MFYFLQWKYKITNLVMISCFMECSCVFLSSIVMEKCFVYVCMLRCSYDNFDELQFSSSWVDIALWFIPIVEWSKEILKSVIVVNLKVISFLNAHGNVDVYHASKDSRTIPWWRRLPIKANYFFARVIIMVFGTGLLKNNQVIVLKR